MVELKAYKINSLNFNNKVQNGTQLKLQNQVKYNVNYIESENRCVGILDFRVSDADMNPFEIRIEMAAQFTYQEGDEKPDIHTDSFDQLFPFLRQVINNLTTMSGMPGLMIPMMKLDRNSVVTGKPKEDGENSPLN
ncbi:MAG: protein-export chaperone SecB [Eubacterium sp.]|nr:protein-export chaperone SecB [Eubacterium sp.]MBR7061147.1 protein-export chaperone SecB [Eubacterium sp.]